MGDFLNDDFLLENHFSQKLYHGYASKMPVIDYHCHLPPKDIAENRNFNDITEAWLEGDHYKWRAMRANGVDEKYCTGEAKPLEKFKKWAETVPYTMRNPLYHWTHLELRRYFGINSILDGETAKNIFEQSSGKLNQPEFSTRGLLKKMKVEVVCTTDDPTDDLAYHKQIAADKDFTIKILPTFRPDKAMAVNDAEAYNIYLDRLADVSDTDIGNYHDFVQAMRKRHDYFNEMGCKLSDHGLEYIEAEDFTPSDVNIAFEKIRNNDELNAREQTILRSSMLLEFARMDHEKGWVQQFHLGAIRNNNPRMMRDLGPDTGFDSIGDFSMARSMSKFFGKLDDTNQLTKTIIYNLNPRDNYLFATMIGNYQDGSVAGKMQFGSGWWFLDQKEAMEMQMNALSNLGLLSRFVGMLTDSRSFLSYPRHEYFRRILCNLIGTDVEKGLLPDDMDWLGKMVQDISYNNAKEYFNF